MISIDYDKLEEVCAALSKFQSLLSSHLNESKRALMNIYFTPVEMMKCPQIGRIQDDMSKLKGMGSETNEDILELISTIRNIIYKFHLSEQKIVHNTGGIIAMNSILLGGLANKNITSNKSILPMSKSESMLSKSTSESGVSNGTTESKLSKSTKESITSKNINSADGVNSDNYSEGGNSFWDAVVGAKVTSGVVAAVDRINAIGIEKEYGPGFKISANQHGKNLLDMGKNHAFRRNLVRNIPKAARDIKKYIPKVKILGKSVGVATLALTGFTVANDFKNNETVPQKFAAAGVDVAMTGVAFGFSSLAIAGVSALATAAATTAATAGVVATAPIIATAVVSVGIAVAVGVGANWATSKIKSAWHLW